MTYGKQAARRHNAGYLVRGRRQLGKEPSPEPPRLRKKARKSSGLAQPERDAAEQQLGQDRIDSDPQTQNREATSINGNRSPKSVQPLTRSGGCDGLRGEQRQEEL